MLNKQILSLPSGSSGIVVMSVKDPERSDTEFAVLYANALILDFPDISPFKI